ncbi:MAG: BspA family leucine-rich repeat surface protein, partial [Patescibacteria group bacterium]
MKKILLLSFIVSFFFVQDVFASVGPTLAEVTPVSPNPTSDTTPDYTFSLDEPSALTYGGSCSSELTGTQGGSSVTITFNELPSGTYSDCTIMATGYSSGVDSNVLNVTPFTIKTDNDFLITVKTDNGGASNNNQFTIPVTSGANYNVDCDDSTASYDVMGRSGAYTCTYPSAGTYTIRISDNVGDDTGFQRIEFSGYTDARKLLSVNNWGTLKWSSMQWAFWGCSNFTGISSGAGSPDLSNVTNMSAMFNGASSFHADISSWDVSNVTDMSFMFEYAQSFHSDLNSW